MKKKWLLPIIVVFVLLTTSYVISARDSIESIKNDLLEKAKFISNYFNYGEGVNLNLGLNKIVDYYSGNCSQTAYIMSRYIESKGYQTRMVGLYAKSGANHLISEANIGGKWITIDASNGVLYPHSVIEILNNIDLLDKLEGTPIDFSKIYTTKEFWNDLNQIKFHHLNEFESPLEAKVLASSNNFMEPNNSADVVVDYRQNTDYAATIGSIESEESWITLDINEVRFVNKVAIDWYSSSDYAEDFQLLGSVDGEKFFKICKDCTKNGIVGSSIEIPVNGDLQYIRFISTEYHGQQRLLIRNIKLFSDPFDWDKFFNKESNAS